MNYVSPLLSTNKKQWLELEYDLDEISLKELKELVLLNSPEKRIFNSTELFDKVLEMNDKEFREFEIAYLKE